MNASPTPAAPADRTRWLVIGALIGLAVAIVASPAFPERTSIAVDDGTSAAEHTISVAATGRVTVRPDVADVRIGVSVTRETATEARDVGAGQMAQVVAAIKAAGVADRDLQTSFLSLQPVYDYSVSGSAPRLTGYQMTNIVTATVRDVETVAAVIDDATRAGATTIDSISFRIDDPTGPENEARKLAMAEAKRRAEALAAEANVRVVGVVSIAESSGNVTPPVYYEKAMTGDASLGGATNIQVGTNEVTLSVSVVYLID